ncbi:MAG TPA: LytTR family DNA-binding domain-containing protein [Parvularculaceae bacterium]|nr:LytTR family DNA-binding domain-containing protein [Parvularculaceae bacterium]
MEIPHGRQAVGISGGHDEIVALKRGDRNAAVIIVVMICASFILSSLTAHADLRRISQDIDWRHAWLNEGTSHAALLLAAAIIPSVINRAPLFVGASFPIAIGVHISGFLAFTLIHVSIMFSARTVLFPTLIGYAYDLDVLSPRNFLYEARKDIFSYALLAFGFYVMREIEIRRLEARAAADKARNEGLLSFKSGGETLQAQTSEIAYARAAGNYAELTLVNGKVFLARMTLARLERLLAEARSDHIRIHRSHIVSRRRVRHVRPDGEGGLEVEMIDGVKLAASRSRRDFLLEKFSELAVAE